MYPTFQALRARFVQEVSTNYGEREAHNLFYEAVHFVCAWSKTELMMRMTEVPEAAVVDFVSNAIHELKLGKPFQFITKRAWFRGHWYHVSEDVLIPRPETEELVNWILEDFPQSNLSVLDVGTGSGVIPISLKMERPAWELFGLDVSERALDVAKRNAASLSEHLIHFYEDNILRPRHVPTVVFDIIVSNPPYVLQSDANLMTERVLKYEPPLALFVPDDDALVFYRHIIAFAGQNLKSGGRLYFELHEEMAAELENLLIREGYLKTEIRKDLQGKDRMIGALKP